VDFFENKYLNPPTPFKGRGMIFLFRLFSSYYTLDRKKLMCH
jgi:hypothetical protein